MRFRPVTDEVDGTPDQIWHVVSPRAIEVAQAYFNCSSLAELPLMGGCMIITTQHLFLSSTCVIILDCESDGPR